jgi:tetratricopeptide (TPR) repeat protein
VVDEAIKQPEELIRAAPRNPTTCPVSEALIQRGDRAKALDQLKKLEARSATTRNFWQRSSTSTSGGEAAGLRRAPRRQDRPGTRAPGRLGTGTGKQGDKTKAQQTWSRIKIMVPRQGARQRGARRVYLEHDMPQQAIEALREAMKLQPKAMKYRKAHGPRAHGASAVRRAAQPSA